MRICPGAMLLVVLTACGDRPAEEGESQVRAARTSVASTEDAVAAVLQSTGTVAAQLQFVIVERPVVGKPFMLELIASAAEPVPMLQVAAESQDLAVEAAPAVLALVEPGMSARHRVAVTPRAEGIAEVVVRLRTDPAGPETVYAIPVLVGKPAA